MARKNSTLKSVADRLLPRSLVWRSELEELRTEQHRREDALSDEIQALRTELVRAREDAARREAEFERRLAAAAAELAAARGESARREAELLQSFNRQLAESAKVTAAVAAEREKLARQGQALRAELESAQEAHGRRERELQRRLDEVMAEFARNLAEARTETAALRRELDSNQKKFSGSTQQFANLLQAFAVERDALVAAREKLTSEQILTEQQIRGLQRILLDVEPEDRAAALPPPSEERAPAPAAAAIGARMALRLLCVGSGRDGTLSIAHMIQDLYDRQRGGMQSVRHGEANGRSAHHEYRAREFYGAFCSHRETGDARYLDAIRGMIADCPHECVVGNGYAAVLPLFAELSKGEMKLMHIRRRDRAACIASLVKDCLMFPAAYKYYAPAGQGRTKRMAAFHFGEMTREAWEALPIEAKFGWYYDKTHRLIAESKALFAEYVEVETEELDAAATRSAVTRLAVGGGEVLPPRTHLNAHHFDIANLPRERQAKMQWLFGRLNFYDLAEDDVYGLQYFLEKFSAWTGYQMSGAVREISPPDARSFEEIARTLKRASRVLVERLKEINDKRLVVQATIRPATSMSAGAERPFFYICHADHGHDRVFAENVLEYLEGEGIKAKAIVLNENGQRPQLQECLQSGGTGVLGFNSQLDHSWIGTTKFLHAAAEKNIPVIQWILDHPSTRLPEFANSTAANSRFLFSSADAERYFRRYGIPGALTATVACVGPSRHSRLDELDIDGFANRPTVCLIAMNLRRPGGTIEEIRERIAALGPPLSHAVEATIERGHLDVVRPLEAHLEQELDARGVEISNATRHACMQMAEEVVQIMRRQKIFEIAREFPILIQSDMASRCFQAGAAARFEENVDMALTWSRLKQARAQVSISNMNDMVHDRILNGLNAGCVNIVEDSFANRRVFEHGRNVLFFSYDDDSLRECLALVSNDLERAFGIAAAGFAMRDDPPFRFGDFRNIIELARERVLQN